MAERENKYNIKHHTDAFALNEHFIVTPGNSTPSNRMVRTIIVVESTTGFSCEDEYLHEDSGAYNTTQIPGMQYNGSYKNVAISAEGVGSLFCVLV